MNFKFRYWDPFNGCMTYSDDFKNLAKFFKDYQLFVDGDKKPILEQSTGFCDENEKEIYEGDVWDFDYCLIPKIVKYDSVEGCYVLIDIVRNDISDNLAVYKNQDKIVGKIIGNIHENPELLKVKGE